MSNLGILNSICLLGLLALLSSDATSHWPEKSLTTSKINHGNEFFKTSLNARE